MNVDLKRQALNRQARISDTTIYGWPAIFFSLPFIAAGVFIILMSLNIILTDDSKFHASRKFVASCGGLFLLAGVWVLIHGIRSQWQKMQYNALKKDRPNEIWQADYTWNPSGIKSDDAKRTTREFWSLVGITCFMIPFVWFAFYSKEHPKIFQIFIGFFMFIMSLFWMHCVYVILRVFKYGENKIQFQQFPFFLGDTMSVVVQTAKPIAVLKNMDIILRCVEEKYEVRGTGKNRSEVVVSYQIYSDALKMENSNMYQAGPVSLPVSFTLPKDDSFQTCLSCRPARYWELELKAKTPGIDFYTSFLLPVYAKP